MAIILSIPRLWVLDSLKKPYTKKEPRKDEKA